MLGVFCRARLRGRQGAHSRPPRDRLRRRAGGAAQRHARPRHARGTVLGFMNAARNGTRRSGAAVSQHQSARLAAVELAHKLFVVLDSRLPARLNELSDRPEGSLANPLKPDQDTRRHHHDRRRHARPRRRTREPRRARSVWLFSRKTLDASRTSTTRSISSRSIGFSAFLTRPRIAGVRLFAWLALVLIVPSCYLPAWGCSAGCSVRRRRVASSPRAR